MRSMRWLFPCFILLAVACGVGTPQRDPSSAGRGLSAQALLQPAGTVVVGFSVDDRANQVFADGDLKWKGSFLVDPASGLMTFDPSWTGDAGAGALSGWPTLHDDGPWTAGGSEPAEAVAGDHVWGTVAFATPPASGEDVYDYGLIDASVDPVNGGWIWIGPNGSFTVPAGATGPITAPGLVLPAFGTEDLLLTLQTHHLSPVWAWDLSSITVKGSAWGWLEVPMTQVGNGKYEFRLSSVVGAGHALPHTGLLRAGDVPQFVFVFGVDEYKDIRSDDGGVSWYGVALTEGVNAFVLPPCIPWLRPVKTTLVWDDWWSYNTAVVVPPLHCAPGLVR